MKKFELQPAKSDKDGSSCLQLTVSHSNSFLSIQLSRKDCLEMAQQLISFANSEENDGE